MHRLEQLKKLICEWVDLDLDKTCTAVDNYTSAQIKRRGDHIYLTRKGRGIEEEYGYFVMSSDNLPTEVVVTRPNTHATVSFIIFALEKTLEVN